MGALTRCLQQLAPYLAGLTIYVAVTQRAPFFNLAQRIAAFRDELIRSSPDSLTATSRLFRPCRFSPGRSMQLCSARETLLDYSRRLL